MPPKPASRAPRAASSSETNPFLLAIASLPLGFLASLFLLHYIGLAVELPAALFPVLDPLGHFIAPYFGRITPNILALEDTVDVKAVEGCELEPRMDACEDIEIHYPSHTAFLACADLESRVKWFPPLVKRERPSVAADPIFAYDLSAGKVGLKRLELKFPENAASRELYTHGLGIWYASKPGQGGQDTAVRLFLVNHKTTGSCISVFDHKLGSNEAIWVRDACHKLIYTPNDVAPISATEFLVTNDHSFLYPPLRTLEDRYGPFPGSTVVKCRFSETTESLACEAVVKKMVAANGVLVSPDGKTVWINSSRGGEIHVYDVVDGKLKLREVVKIGSAVDNLSFDPATGTTYFALFPSRTQLYHHFHNPLNSSQRAPSAIGKLVPGGWELVYRDEGTLLADGTVGVSDQVAGVSLVGGVMTRGTVVCAKAF